MSLKYLYVILGIASLIAAVFGAILPLLPTTPFLILSAFFFKLSSPRLHLWLLSSRSFGPIINDWETSRVIRRPVKLKATAAIFILTPTSIVLTSPPIAFSTLIVITITCVLTFIWLQRSSTEH